MPLEGFKKQEVLKLKGAYQLLVYDDDVNILGGSVHTINKNTKSVVVASKETGLEVNAEKCKYMVMSQDQNAGQNHNVKTDNKSFERVEQLKYLGTTPKNQNSVQEEIKSRMKWENASYHLVQNFLYSTLLSKNIKIKIYKTIILSVVLYDCATWTLTLREECRLGVLENRVMRRIYGPKRDEATGEWR
jgi:hypothetical protein